MFVFLAFQLRCSASYAFAVVGALEGAVALSGDGLVSLSTQNIVDCSGKVLHIETHPAQIVSKILVLHFLHK